MNKLERTRIHQAADKLWEWAENSDNYEVQQILKEASSQLHFKAEQKGRQINYNIVNYDEQDESP